MTCLKPCPFCGSSELVSGWDFGESDGQTTSYVWKIECNGCGVTAVVDLKDGPHRFSEYTMELRRVAVDKWNRRAGE